MARRGGTEPSSIRAKLSSDNGATWSDDIVLRDDGASRDVGYPRVLQRPDGKVVVLYYFTVKGPDPERFIAATIWDPADFQPERRLRAYKQPNRVTDSSAGFERQVGQSCVQGNRQLDLDQIDAHVAAG